MSQSNRGKWYSEEELRGFAKQLRKFFGLDGNYFIDVVKCLNSRRIWTVFGIKNVVLEIVTHEDQMHGTDAEYWFRGDDVFVKIRASVYSAALSAQPRARMTLAHELGHIVLGHDRPILARLTGANSNSPMSSATRSFEAPANRFASHFLVDLGLADSCRSTKEISTKFGVSETHAGIIQEKLAKKRDKPIITEGFDTLKRDLDGQPAATKLVNNVNIPEPTNNNQPRRRTTVVLWAPCYCGGRLNPFNGNKFRCEDCGYIGDPADGDSYGT